VGDQDAVASFGNFMASQITWPVVLSLYRAKTQCRVRDEVFC